MLFKIDENLHDDVAVLIRQHGYDALTVHDQRLVGESDETIADVCKREKRAVVTLDLDFSDIRLFPPNEYYGIIVLRLNNQSRAAVLETVEEIIPLFAVESLIGNLWIVNETGIRIREGT